jgi:DNA-directed RNA polymerase subunit RPC12/RpoP
MRVECIHCGKQYSLQDESAGTHFNCRRCGKISPVAALSAAAIEGTATHHGPIDTAGQQSTGEPTAACPACGKRHRLPPKAPAAWYKCSACGSSMPAERPDAQSAGADQVVSAEAIAAPGTALPSTSELATPGGADDLFSETLPPTSGHVLSSAPALNAPSALPQPSRASITATCEQCGERYALPQAAAGKKYRCNRCGATNPVPSARPAQAAVTAVVDESNSYRLAPEIVEAVLARPAALAKPAPRRAASKKRKVSRSDDDILAFLRPIGGVAAIICGALLILWGIMVLFDTKDPGNFRRRPFGLIGAGISLIAVGYRLFTGQSNSHD